MQERKLVERRIDDAKRCYISSHQMNKMDNLRSTVSFSWQFKLSLNVYQ